MSKKGSLLDRAEQKAGLAVKLFSIIERGKLPESGSCIDCVDSGKVTLNGLPAINDPYLVLSIAMHTYIDVASRSPKPHFAWDDLQDSPKFSDLGYRLLLCLDLFELHLRTLPRPWDDGGIFLESAYVTMFRSTLVVAGNKIRSTYQKKFLEQIQWTREDVTLLQRALDVALKRIERPWTCSVNRRLYVEMGKTKRSIKGYISALQKKGVQPEVLQCTMQMREGHFNLPDNGEMFGTNTSIIPLASSYMASFKSASVYVALIKKTWPEYLIGHLIKVSQSAEGRPQCIMFLFFKPFEYAQKSWTTRLEGLAIDFSWDHARKLGAVPSFEFLSMKQSTELGVSDKNVVGWDRVWQLVDALFIRELRYRRIKLPERSRSWSKGVVKE